MVKYSKNLIFRGKNILLELPVRITSVVSENKSPVHDTCLECQKGFVGQKRYCKGCNLGWDNDPIPKEQIGSGIEITEDDLKVFTKEELAEIKIESNNINITGFQKTEDLDLSLRQNQKSYYLYPAKKDSDAKKMYAMIFNGLKDTNKSMVATWKVSSRSSRDTEVVITPMEDILVIRQIAYKEELNEVDEPIDLTLDEEEQAQGKTFIDSIPEAKLDDLVDKYQAKLEEILSGKPKKQVSVTAGKPKEKKNLFGLSPDQLKKAQEALQSKAKTVKKAIEETTTKEVDEAIDKDLSKTEKAKTKGGKKTK
jgi:hypothetical protein